MHTYFISDGTRVKIGKSRYHPAKRLAQLQTANATPLTLIAFMMGDHEKTWHQLFAIYRRQGEWFALNTDQIQLIVSLTAPPLPPYDKRCIAVNADDSRCTNAASYLHFCTSCPIGRWLYLTEKDCALLASVPWTRYAEATTIMSRQSASATR